MTKQAVEMLDMAILVIFLALCIATGWKSVFGANQRAWYYNGIYWEDKNTSKKNGYDVKEYGDYDGTISRLEVVLMTQIQDYNMPYPRKVKINGNEMEITAAYKAYLTVYGNNGWNSVKEDSSDGRYAITYHCLVSDNYEIEDEWFDISKYERPGEENE